MLITDLTRTLPRTSPWPTRTAPIDCIVIHHSVTPSDYPLDRIAEYHVGRGYPGIAYHYAIPGDGAIYRTNPDNLFTWHGHDGNSGLGICLLGDFTTSHPTEAQLSSASWLVAYLRGLYGPLPVLGHRECGRAATACPGATWPQWRDRLETPPTGEDMATDWSRYPRPPDDTGAGVHGGANAYHPLGDNDGLIPGILDEMHRCGLRWVKLLDADGSSYNACRMALERGMMPVVRLYRERPYPGTLTDKQLAAARDLVNLGVRYFERGNEPNVDWEWQPDKWPGYDWNAWTAATFDALARDWFADAQKLASIGAFVAVDACSPGGHYDDIMYLQRFFAALKQVDGAASLLHEHGWLAVHPAGLNHPLDYPDDPVNQAEHPGQTIHSHFDGIQPTGASNCIRKPEAVYKLFVDTWGFGIPVMGTEGGFWPGRQDDSRYPETSVQTASEMNAATLRGMATAPPWYLAMMPWLWFNRLGANLEQGFERDAWKRVPGFGSCPGWEPAVQPIVNMLLREPCQRRQTAVMPEPTTPQPTDPTPKPSAFTAEDMQRAREGLGIVPATIKAAVERDYVWLKEIYTPGDEYALALVWDGTGYRVLKLDARQWQVVGEAAL